MTATAEKVLPTLRDVVLDAGAINPVAYTFCRSIGDAPCACECHGATPCERMRISAVYATLVAMAIQRRRG
jgi:hypothetical protein